MKYLLILLLSFCAFAQTDSISRSNISVISAEKLNVVYRGIDNPIKIAVPGAVSFAVSAPGIKRGIGIGNYILNPGQGNEVNVMISATMPDGKLLNELKTFRIKGLPAPTGVLNDDSTGSYMMTKEMLMGSQVNIIFKNMLLYECNVDFGVKQFDIVIPLKHRKQKTFVVEGNKMSKEVNILLQEVEPGNFVVITNIRMWNKTEIFIDKGPSTIAVEIY